MQKRRLGGRDLLKWKSGNDAVICHVEQFLFHQSFGLHCNAREDEHHKVLVSLSGCSDS